MTYITYLYLIHISIVLNRHPNVLILTTSNLSGSVDIAFIDRADIRRYIGLPSQSAIYQIYHSCIMELVKVSIVPSQTVSRGSIYYVEKVCIIYSNDQFVMNVGVAGRSCGRCFSVRVVAATRAAVH